MRLNSYPFNGWDWQELARAWNVYIPESYSGKDMFAYAEKNRTDEEFRNRERKYTVLHDDGTEEVKDWNDLFDNSLFDWDNHGYENFDGYEPLLWYINTAMKKYDGVRPTRVMRKMANDIRAFCKALVEQDHTYLTPVWKGLSEVQEDWTLIGFITMNNPILPAMWD